jgi:hypothetical protein
MDFMRNRHKLKTFNQLERENDEMKLNAVAFKQVLKKHRELLYLSPLRFGSNRMPLTGRELGDQRNLK